MVRVPGEGAPEAFRITKLFGTRGIDRIELERARAGDIIMLAGIDSIVMGRSTYEQAAAMDRGLWDDKRVWVLTRRPIENARPNVRAFDDPAALVAQLKDEGRGDVWHMGGGLSIQPFEQAGLIDRWELVIIPIRLGAGIPLFVDGPETRLKLTKVKQRPLDVVELWYEPALGGAA